MLSLRGIAGALPGVQVLGAVDVGAGGLHAPTGGNGAGKSTLTKIAAGLLPQDEGTIALGGRALRFDGPADAEGAGIYAVFRELTVLANRAVAENLAVGHEPARAGGLWLDRAEMRRRAAPILEDLGIQLDPEARADALGTVQRQPAEVARACARGHGS